MSAPSRCKCGKHEYEEQDHPGIPFLRHPDDIHSDVYCGPFIEARAVNQFGVEPGPRSVVIVTKDETFTVVDPSVRELTMNGTETEG